MFNCTKIAGVEYYFKMGADAAQALGKSPHEVDSDGNIRDYATYLSDNGAGETAGKWMRFGAPSASLANSSSYSLSSPSTLLAGIEDGAEVSNRMLRDLSAGKDPVTGKVVANKKTIKGVRKDPGGYDMQMSQCKSLSVASLLLFESGNEAGKIADIHERALRKAYQWAWDQGLFVTRIDGKYEPVREVALATFKHSTSRAEDPHEHTHGALMKTAVAMDGSIRQLDNYLLRKYGGAIAAIYRAEEAKLVKEELGLAVVRNGRNYEIAGFPEKVVELFSKRRSDIEKVAREMGITPAEARQAMQVISNHTREDKAFTPLHELRDRWDAELAAKGWDRETIVESMYRSARQQEADRAESPETAEERKERLDGLVMKALDGLVQNNAVFTQAALYREAFEALQTEGIGADAAFQIVRDLETSGRIEKVETNRPEPVYTTAEMRAMEQEVIRLAHGRQDEREFIPEAFAEAFVAERMQVIDPETGEVIKKGLNAEQAAAVLHAAGRDGHVSIQGAAGTGKSFSTRVTKEMYEAQGFTAYGCAPSWKATDVLRQDAGLDEDKCFATAKILSLMVKKGELKLDSKSLLIVDEAGMIGTEEYLMLQKVCDETGAKLLTQGDDMQYAAVAAGSPFAMVNRVIEPARLVDIQRQKGTTKGEGELMRAISKDFAHGKPETTVRALETLDREGMIQWCDDDQDAIEAFVRDYMEDRLARPDQSRGATTQFNADSSRISAVLRERLREEGLLSREAVEIQAMPRGSTVRTVTLELSEGDEIVFGESVKLDGQGTIRNNDTGRIVTISGDTSDPLLTVELHKGLTITARVSELVGYRGDGPDEDGNDPLPAVPKIMHSYVMTGHAFQGMTVDNHFDLALNNRGREGTYVCSTRHRHRFRMYVDSERIADRLATSAPGKMSLRQGGPMTTTEEDDRTTEPTLADVKKAFFAEASGADEFGNVADHIATDKLLEWAGIEKAPAPIPEEKAMPTVAAVKEAVQPILSKLGLRRFGAPVNPSPTLVTTAAEELKKRMEDRKTAPAGYRVHLRVTQEERDKMVRVNLVQFAQDHLGFSAKAKETWTGGATLTSPAGEDIAISKKGDVWVWSLAKHSAAGGGMIWNLVAHETGKTVGEAMHWLRDRLKTWTADPSRQVATERGKTMGDGSRDPEAIRKLRFRFSKMEQGASPYLVERGLDPAMLKRLGADVRSEGDGQYAGVNKNGAAFAHRNAAGEITSYVRRGYKQIDPKDGELKTFRQHATGGEPNIFQAGERRDPSRIYVSESAIDSLSRYQLDGQPAKALITSTDGQPSERALEIYAELARQNPATEWHMGMDGDEAGRIFAEKVKEAIRKGHPEANIIDRTPPAEFKDANDELQGITRDQAEKIKADEKAKIEEEQARRREEEERLRNSQDEDAPTYRPRMR